MLKTKDYLSGIKMLFLLLIPVSVIAIFVIVIPYAISIETLFVTPIIFISMMSFLIFLRSKYFWSKKDRKLIDKASTIISWIIFIIVMPFSVLLALLIVLIYKKSIYFLIWVLSVVVTFIFGIRVKTKGKLPKEQCIVIYNHCSNIDDLINPIIMGYRKWKVVFAQGEKRIPFVVTFLKYIGIPLSREEMKSRKEISGKVISYLNNEKGNILVFPEGRRLLVDKKEELLLTFKPGAFKWSTECNVPVMPVIVSWTYLIKPRSGQWWFSPKTIVIDYLDPVFTKECEKVDDFSDRVRLMMLEKLKEALKKKRRWRLI